MADIETPQQQEIADTPKDFASIALKLTKTDPDAPKEQAKETVKEPAKEAAKEPSKIPSELFKQPDKETEKPTESKSAIDEIQAPETKDPRSKDRWDKLVAKGKEFEKTATDRAARIAELESKVKESEQMGFNAKDLQAKLDAALKEREDALSLVRKVNVELDPEFRRMHVEGRNKLISNAKTIVEESGGEGKDVETALNLRGKPRADALAAVAETLNAFQSGRLGRIIDELSALDDAAEAKRTNPDEYLKTRAKEDEVRTAKEREEQARVSNSAFDLAEQRLSKELEVLRHADGFDDWNAKGEAIRKRAREQWAKGVDFETAAAKFIQAEAVGEYRALFLDQQAEAQKALKKVSELEAELKSMHGRGPGLRGSGGGDKAGVVDFASQAAGLMNGSIQPK